MRRTTRQLRAVLYPSRDRSRTTASARRWLIGQFLPSVVTLTCMAASGLMVADMIWGPFGGPSQPSGAAPIPPATMPQIDGDRRPADDSSQPMASGGHDVEIELTLARPEPPAIEWEESAAPERDTAEVPPADSEADAEAQAAPVRTITYRGKTLRAVRTIRMEVTAYSPDAQSCGQWADGITASGYSVEHNGGKLVAADTSVLPFHTLITVPGYHDEPVPVLDRGGAIKGNRLDVLYPTHERALQWGRQHDVEVTVWEEVTD